MLTFEKWRVFLVDGCWHVVGWCVEDQAGRVTSAIAGFDPVLHTAVTKSGRRYLLTGPPGDNGDADYTWHRWKHVHQVNAVLEVTGKVLAALS